MSVPYDAQTTERLNSAAFDANQSEMINNQMLAAVIAEAQRRQQIAAAIQAQQAPVGSTFTPPVPQQSFRPTRDQLEFPSFFLTQENNRKLGRGDGGLSASQILFSGSAIAGVGKRNKSAFEELFGDRL